jgi:hypothetical protein
VLRDDPCQKGSLRLDGRAESWMFQEMKLRRTPAT